MKRLRAAPALGAALLGLVGATLLVDLPRRAGRRFWSDGATYHAMAGSLARDFDLRFRSRTGRTAGANDPRFLGAFVEIELHAERPR